MSLLPRRRHADGNMAHIFHRMVVVVVLLLLSRQRADGHIAHTFRNGCDGGMGIVRVTGPDTISSCRLSVFRTDGCVRDVRGRIVRGCLLATSQLLVQLVNEGKVRVSV
jgi:hypothetical protein